MDKIVLRLWTVDQTPDEQHLFYVTADAYDTVIARLDEGRRTITLLDKENHLVTFVTANIVAVCANAEELDNARAA